MTRFPPILVVSWRVLHFLAQISRPPSEGRLLLHVFFSVLIVSWHVRAPIRVPLAQHPLSPLRGEAV